MTVVFVLFPFMLLSPVMVLHNGTRESMKVTFMQI